MSFAVYAVDLDAMQAERGVIRYVIACGQVGTTIYSDDEPLTIARRLAVLAGDIRREKEGMQCEQ